MAESPPPSASVPIDRPVIEYQSPAPAQKRPWWAHLILAVYLLLVAGMLNLPVWMAHDSANPPDTIIAAGAVALLALCGVGLLVIPVRVARMRPIARRSILIPILISGFLLGTLVFGGAIAAAQWFAPANANFTDHTVADSTGWAIVAAAVGVWIAWSIVIIMIVRRRDPTDVGMTLHRALIAGSALELLVAVPAHIAVRRRGDCCGGILTGTGICIGVAVALISIGPTVFLLYYFRCRKIKIPRR